VWKEISETIDSLDVVSFGAGGAALVLAMAVDSRLNPCIHKVSFVECEDYVAKALSMTTRMGVNPSSVYRASPVVGSLKRRAIMFVLDSSPMGKVVRDEKESGCGCPVVSVRAAVAGSLSSSTPATQFASPLPPLILPPFYMSLLT